MRNRALTTSLYRSRRRRHTACIRERIEEQTSTWKLPSIRIQAATTIAIASIGTERAGQTDKVVEVGYSSIDRVFGKRTKEL